MLKNGDEVGIVACSDAIKEKERSKLTELSESLRGLGLSPVFSPYIFEQDFVFTDRGERKAKVLNDFFGDSEIKAVFDVSGGDIANETLDYINFDLIKRNPKPFFGYSDLTTVINAIYAKTGNVSYLYQVKCLVWENGRLQLPDFRNSILEGGGDLFKAKWEFIKGHKIDGVVVGGNLRCFLKLAGTQYIPDLSGKVLFLESYGGGPAQMTTYLSQLKQMGAFSKITGLLLGTFTKMEENNEVPCIDELVLRITDGLDLPIAKTSNIGHGNTSKCLEIGKRFEVSKIS